MTCPVSSTPGMSQALSKSFLLTLIATLSQESLIGLLIYDEAKGWGITGMLSLLIRVLKLEILDHLNCFQNKFPCFFLSVKS